MLIQNRKSNEEDSIQELRLLSFSISKVVIHALEQDCANIYIIITFEFERQVEIENLHVQRLKHRS